MPETPVQDAIFQHSLSPEPGHAEQQQALPGSDLPGALQAMLGSSVPQISQQASHAHAEVCSHASHCNELSGPFIATALHSALTNVPHLSC